MTPLYRFSGEPPPFRRGSLWTTDRDQAQKLAKFEVLPNSLPADAKLYGCDDSIDYVVAWDVADTRGLQRVAEREWTPAEMFEQATQHVPTNCRWVLLTESGNVWRGAHIYVGPEPLGAARAPMP
jgi:hypothetical protein